MFICVFSQAPSQRLSKQSWTCLALVQVQTSVMTGTEKPLRISRTEAFRVPNGWGTSREATAMPDTDAIKQLQNRRRARQSLENCRRLGCRIYVLVICKQPKLGNWRVGNTRPAVQERLFAGRKRLGSTHRRRVRRETDAPPCSAATARRRRSCRGRVPAIRTMSSSRPRATTCRSATARCNGCCGRRWPWIRSDRALPRLPCRSRRH
jgi:hypothetical protein